MGELRPDPLDLLLRDQEMPKRLPVNFFIDLPCEAVCEIRRDAGIALDNIGIVQYRAGSVLIDLPIGRNEPVL